MGDPTKPDTDMGPLISRTALARVQKAIEKANGEGASATLSVWSSKENAESSVIAARRLEAGATSTALRYDRTETDAGAAVATAAFAFSRVAVQNTKLLRRTP